MQALTPSERRGALIVLLVLALGAARDLMDRGSSGLPAQPILEADIASPEFPLGVNRAPPAPAAPAGPTAALPLDLNRATEADLDALPGIGPVLARRIGERRARSGRFRRVEELLLVQGIGPRLLARLRPCVTVSRTARDSTALRSSEVHSAAPTPPGRADSASADPLRSR